VQEYKASSNGELPPEIVVVTGHYDSMKYSSILNDELMPDAASEKEQVEYKLLLSLFNLLEIYDFYRGHMPW
jgi:hypothetical protein